MIELAILALFSAVLLGLFVWVERVSESRPVRGVRLCDCPACREES